MTAELIDRVRRGEATVDEVAALTAWRRESPDNERVFRDVMRLLDAGRVLASVPVRGGRLTAAQIIARTQRSERRWIPWSIAAAAVLAAGVSMATRATKPVTTTAGWGETEVVTGATELATVQLGEGSVVRLAPSSRLRVLAGRERAVSLEGRAFFAIRRLPGNPLRVHTAAGDARVLGTRFELAANANGLDLRVVEGRVALSTSRDNVEVVAGQESAVRNGAASRPKAAAPAAVASWVGTFLAFQATPLRDVAREIERVYKTPVTIGDSTLAAETITATFTDRPVQEVVNVVCSVLSATCDVRDGQVRIAR